MFDRVGHVVRNEMVGIPKLVMSGDNWYKRYGNCIAHMPGENLNYLPLSNVSSRIVAGNVKQTIIHSEHSHFIKRHYHTKVDSVSQASDKAMRHHKGTSKSSDKSI
jgi:hypothetical protein